MPHKILKPIPKGDGSFLSVGEIVDASKWRNMRTLVNGRYLVEVMEAPKPVKQVKVEEPKVEEPKAEGQAPIKPRKVKSNVNL